MPEALWTSGTAFLIALVLTPIIRDVFHAYNIVDRPGFRKVHAYPIPRLGGISVGVAFTIGLARAAGTPDGESLLWKILPGAGVVMTVGILDDFWGLPARFKLLGQTLAAAVAFWYGLRIETLAGISIPLALSIPLTLLWFLLLMNALNLIDGLDGLCGGLGFVGAAGLYAAASIRNETPLLTVMPPMAGALLGFLCYNFSRATMFLGDSGALFIGFLIGAGGIMLTAEPSTLDPPINPAVAVMVIAVPLLDVGLSIMRRFLANRNIFGADRGHIHHRLLDSGFPTRSVALLLYLWAAIGAVFGVFAALPIARGWQIWILIGFCGIALAGVSALRYPEFKMAGRLLFAGDLRRTIQRKEKLASLAAALGRSKTEDEWWDLVVKMGTQSGWVELLWTRDQAIHRRKVFLGETPHWCFSVALSAKDDLKIQGILRPADAGVDMVEFAHAVHGALDAGGPLAQPRGQS